MSHDTELLKSVIAELSWEPSISAAHIGVTADNGVVSLSGHVESFMEKHAAETAARRVKGVKGVADEIEVRLPYHVKRADDEIAAAAVSRLSWDVSIPKDSLKVTVDKGWVTLTGEVEWHYQKDAAELDIRGLFGVLGVSSQITIKPQVDTVNLSDKITTALHRSWFYDPKTIWVSATGGKVRLTGTVHSWHDRQVAGDTAWAAPGATAVDNEIAVV
ncbi:BON domain-containing protein [Bosea sp. PAMC 26642]|uniref:BON domain-containing protein n=1 Tax=Bosea sp. (strain PAMC 26642) TaxID=1792307 RepID=UPI0007701D49|nr:BON domain-containing protein [Bosea sp. PAMC 26642]AMJ59669.1 ornithine aminotransferase [Bosea sp. PAMC 26642]